MGDIEKSDFEKRPNVIIGSGITKRKFTLDAEAKKYVGEITKGNSIFPDIFPPDRLPGDCHANTPIFSADELKTILGKVLLNFGLPDNLRGVIWLGKDNWIEMPGSVKDAYEEDEILKVQAFIEKYDAENKANISISNVNQATKDDIFVLSDSPGGYAARLLALLPSNIMLNRIKKGEFFDPDIDVNALFLQGISFGLVYREAQLKFTWEDYAITGEKVTKGGEKGNKNRFGSETKRQEKNIKYQVRVNEILTSHPNMNLTKARDIAAAEFGVSAKTIQRAMASPKK